MAFRSAAVGACARRGITATIDKRISKAFLCFRISASRTFCPANLEREMEMNRPLDSETPERQVAFQPQASRLARCSANMALRKTLKFQRPGFKPLKGDKALSGAACERRNRESRPGVCLRRSLGGPGAGFRRGIRAPIRACIVSAARTHLVTLVIR